MSGGLWALHMKYEDGLLQSNLETEDSLLQTIEHGLRSTGLKLVLFMATRWLYWGHICSQISCIYVSTILFSFQFYLH